MRRDVRQRIVSAFAAAFAACALVLAGCAPAPAAPAQTASTRTVTDMAGRSVEIPAQVDRVVGIGASSLRMICYLQSADKVVGVEQAELEDTVRCAYRHVYHKQFQDLPVIGTGGSKGVVPNEEALIAAGPQVIVASIDKDSAESLQQKTNIPVVVVAVGDTVFDQKVYDDLTLLGQVLGKEERSSQLVGYMKDAEKDLESRTKDVQEKTAYAAGISFRGSHGFTGTEAGFPPFAICHAQNIADKGHDRGCFDIDPEAIAAAQPDDIFIESGNLGLVKEDVAANPDYFRNLDAVKAGRTYSLVSYRFYATNTELALANCYQVGCCMYPDRFQGIDPTSKLDEIATVFLGAPIAEDLASEGCRFETYDLLGS